MSVTKLSRRISKKRAARPSGPAPRRETGQRRGELFALSKTDLIALVGQLRDEAGRKAAPDVAEAPKSEAPKPETSPRTQSLIIDQPVRSGQMIEFLHGDVIVLGSVSSGAEIVAGGSIHVYGALRGRALAGAAGNQQARIFCRSFHAELLSIDGRYRVAENFGDELKGRCVQARLDGTGMVLAPLD